MRRLFWGSLAKLAQSAASGLGQGYLRRYGVIDRPRLFSEAEIRFATNSGSPESCFNYFIGYQGGHRIEKGTSRKITRTLTVNPFTFQSPFLSLSGKNNLVPALLYRNHHESPAVIILVGGAYISFNSWDRMLARMLAGSDFDCCVLALPYHGPRAIYQKSGLGFIVPDPVAVAESFIQTVLDINCLREILADTYGYERIYIVGVSVGGNAALVSSLFKDYEGVSAIMTGIPLADIFWYAPHPYAAEIQKKMAERYSLDDLRRLWLMSDISQWKTMPRCEKLLLVNGLFDDFVKPEYARRLFNFLPQAETFVYPVGHYDPMFFMRSAVRNILNFFSGKPIVPTKCSF